MNVVIEIHKIHYYRNQHHLFIGKIIFGNILSLSVLACYRKSKVIFKTNQKNP